MGTNQMRKEGKKIQAKRKKNLHEQKINSIFAVQIIRKTLV